MIRSAKSLKVRFIQQSHSPGYRPVLVGRINVYGDSTSGTLNDFLMAMGADDLTPDVVRRFEQLVAQAEFAAQSAAESKNEAAKFSQAAEEHATQVTQAQQAVASIAEQVRHDAYKALIARDDVVTKTAVAQEAADTATQKAESAARHESAAAEYARQAQEAASSAGSGSTCNCADKAPLDSPNFSGKPTAPTPPSDAKGNEIATAEFVRRLIAELISPPVAIGPPLTINRVQMQSSSATQEPLTINRAQLQSGSRTQEPLTINKMQLQSAKSTQEPLAINRIQLQFGDRTREPITINSVHLNYAETSE